MNNKAQEGEKMNDREKLDIKKIPTNELIEELISRDGVKIVEIGLFCNYELKAKYGSEPISANRAIVFPLEMILNP